MINKWRMIQYTDDGCELYQCLHCYNSWEARTNPKWGKWKFCPVCGTRWDGQLKKNEKTKYYPYDTSVGISCGVWKFQVSEIGKFEDSNYDDSERVWKTISYVSKPRFVSNISKSSNEKQHYRKYLISWLHNKIINDYMTSQLNKRFEFGIKYYIHYRFVFDVGGNEKIINISDETVNRILKKYEEEIEKEIQKENSKFEED